MEDGSIAFSMNPTLSTRWIAVEPTNNNTVYVRLSQARTASHGDSVLRSPIDGGGFALELTDFPSGADPRNAMTLFVFQPKREADLRYPWSGSRAAGVFDLRQYETEPYTVGPLYGGFPNQVSNDELLLLIKLAVRTIITRTLKD